LRFFPYVLLVIPTLAAIFSRTLDNTFKRKDKNRDVISLSRFVDLMMGEDLTNLLAEAPSWNLREGKKGTLSVFVERPTNLDTD
jgi:hypothetical protein